MAFSFGNWKKPKGHVPASEPLVAPSAAPAPAEEEDSGAPEPTGPYQGMVVKPIPIHEPLSSKQQKKISARIHIPPISLRNPDDASNPPPKAKLTSPVPLPPAPMAGKFAPPKGAVPPAPSASGFGGSRYATPQGPPPGLLQPAPPPFEEPAPQAYVPAYQPEPELESEPEPEPEPEPAFEAIFQAEPPAPEPLTGIPVLPVIPMSPSLRVPAGQPVYPEPPAPAPEPSGPRSSLLRRSIPLPPPPDFSPKRTASIAQVPISTPTFNHVPPPRPVEPPRPANPMAPPRYSPMESRQTELAPAPAPAPHLARRAEPAAAPVPEPVAPPAPAQQVIYNPGNNPYAGATNYAPTPIYQPEPEVYVEPEPEWAPEPEPEPEPALEAQDDYGDLDAGGDVDDLPDYSTAVFQRRTELVSALFLKAPPRVPAPPFLGPRIEESDERLSNGHRPVITLRAQPVAPAPVPSPAPLPPPPAPITPPPPPRLAPVRQETPRPLNLGSVPSIPLETKRLLVAKGQTPLLPVPPASRRTPAAEPPAFPPAPLAPARENDDEVLSYHQAVQELGLPEGFDRLAAPPAPVLPPPPVAEEAPADYAEFATPEPEPEPIFAEAAPFQEEAPADYAQFVPEDFTPAPEPEAVYEPEPEPLEPAIESYLAEAEAATAAAREQNPAMYDLMGDHTVDARKIAAAIARLPGLSHCVIMFNDGLLLAGELPEPLNIDALSAIAPQFLNKVNGYSEELAIGTTRLFTIYCDRGIISFFTGRGICVSVIHREAGFQAGTRELLERVTSELAQIYAP
jgi:predicted regulator of Ras-like GTPase activity (Roadblock/LC7/MglB family)